MGEIWQIKIWEQEVLGWNLTSEDLDLVWNSDCWFSISGFI